jgi:hypothetical protein
MISLWFFFKKKAKQSQNKFWSGRRSTHLVDPINSRLGFFFLFPTGPRSRSPGLITVIIDTLFLQHYCVEVSSYGEYLYYMQEFGMQLLLVFLLIQHTILLNILKSYQGFWKMGGWVPWSCLNHFVPFPLFFTMELAHSVWRWQVWINLGPLLYHFADVYGQEDVSFIFLQ